MANYGDEDRVPTQLADPALESKAGQGASFAELVAQVDQDPGCAAFPSLAEAYRRAGQAARARDIAQAGLEHAPTRFAGRVAMALSLLDLADDRGASQLLASIFQDVPSIPADFDAEVASASRDAAASPIPVASTQSELPTQEHPEWATPLAEPSSAPHSMTAREVPNELGNDEIDEAFASAEPDPDGMLDAEPLALASDPENVYGAGKSEPHPSKSGLFGTETMASLLEVQGDHEGADEIRAQLNARSGSDGGAASTLENAAAEPLIEDAALAPEPSIELASGDDDENGDRDRILGTLDSWLDNIRKEVA
jgi:hypothetical protein